MIVMPAASLMVWALLVAAGPQPAPAAAPSAQPPAATPIEGTPAPKAQEKAGASTPKATVELLTPPLDVTTTNGAASISFRLLLAGTTEPIDTLMIAATPAVADGRALPKDAVTVTLNPPESRLGEKRLLLATLDVRASKAMAPNVKYTGVLLIGTVGSVAYSVTDKTSVVLAADRDRLAVTWSLGEPDSTRLRVTNNGTTTGTLALATVSLEESGSKRRIEESVALGLPGSVACDGSTAATNGSSSKAGASTTPDLTIEPGGSLDVFVCLPRPRFAGTYAGTFVLRAVTGESHPIPMTVVSRGPAPNGQLWVPPILFMLTLVIGIALSWMLDRFFGDGGGLRRAELVVALGALESELERAQSRLRDLVASSPPLALAMVLLRLGSAAESVRRSRTTPNGTGVEAVLSEGAAANGAALRLLDLLPQAREILRNDPTALRELDTTVQALPWPTDQATLMAFDRSVQAAIATADANLKERRAEKLAQAVAAGAANDSPQGAEHGDPTAVLKKGTPITVDAALRQIALMTSVQNGAIWLLTVLTGYQTFYAGNPGFGTLVNYGAVFMWALGLTQAGTQIVARARRPVS
jgi:hypothetical protein